MTAAFVHPLQSPRSERGLPAQALIADQNRLKFHISNRVTLIGFVGEHAEVRNTKNQTRFTILSLATKRSWKDRESGEYKSQTTWHRCIAFGHVGEYAAKLTKGTQVQIEGEIQTRADLLFKRASLVPSTYSRKLNPPNTRYWMNAQAIAHLTEANSPSRQRLHDIRPLGVARV